MSGPPNKIRNGIIFTLTAILAVFVDGYTFMMIATFALLALPAFTLSESFRKRNVIPYAVIVYIAGFGIAYALYTLVLGIFNFTTNSMDFFRGWGADLAMLLIPTQGISWLWDTLGLSVVRNEQRFFGDWSVWNTTFSFQFMVTGVLGFAFFRKKRRALIFSLVALVGLYLALGPSLKINSVRAPAEIQAHMTNPEMAADQAIAPTGNGILYEYLPGFKNMRSTYRWMGLSLLGFWALTGLLLVALNRKGRNIASYALIFSLFLLTMPNLPDTVEAKINDHRSFHLIDQDLVSLIRESGLDSGRVVFAPRNNDFLVNYLAAMTPFSTYNIGGDKNIEMAEKYWPVSVANLPNNDVGRLRKIDVLAPLLIGDAENVIVPYFDTSSGAHSWPVSDSEIAARKNLFTAVKDELKEDERVNVKENLYFVLVSLKEDVEPIVPRLSSGTVINTDGRTPDGYYLAKEGWWGFRRSKLWSSEQSQLRIPVDDSCLDDDCLLELTYAAYHASPSRPVRVDFSVLKDGIQQHPFSKTARDQRTQFMSIPIKAVNLDERNQLNVTINVPDATSPWNLGVNTGVYKDYRNYGILLHSVGVTSNFKS